MEIELPAPFRLAKVARAHSNFTTYKMGAVIIKKRRPVAVGFNSLKTHTKLAPAEEGKAWSIHAEISAISHAIGSIKGADIYIYREDAGGYPALARPCHLCELSLRALGVKRMYYTVSIYPYYECEDL